MALARVVSFEGVSSERMAELDRELRDGGPPEGVRATELVVLHDAGASRALVVLFFDSDEDYRKADEILDAMPASETPGRRTSASRYEVVRRLTP